MKTGGIVHVVVLLLAAEKTLQHLLTALFFAFEIPGIGTPDIGARFSLGNFTMVALNLAYAAAIAAALYGLLRSAAWALRALLALALSDILLEFAFHGFGYITVSVIASLALSAAIALRLSAPRP